MSLGNSRFAVAAIAGVLISTGVAVAPTANAAAPAPVTFSPGGDFDGDGLGDVLAYRFGEPPRVEARRGMDGAVLWSHALDPDTPTWPWYGRPYAARVGVGAQPGAFIVTHTRAANPGGVDVAALGRNGQTVWKRDRVGLINRVAPDGVTPPNHPYKEKVADLVGNAADDLVVASRTRDQLQIGAGARRYTLVVTVLNGANGNTAYERTFATRGYGYIWFVPDVSGDGKLDFLLIDDTQMRGYSGATGAPLFSRPDGNPYAQFSAPQVVPAGDVTGDGRIDFLLDGVMVSGADGTDVWDSGTRDGLHWAAGDLDGDGRTDIATVAYVGSKIARYRALSGAAGNPIYTVDYPSVAGATRVLYDWLVLVGDVDGDGVADAAHGLDSEDCPPRAPCVHLGTERGVVSGRTGVKIWDGLPYTPVGRGIGGTLDGSGPDLMRLSSGRPFAGLDGATGTVLWEVGTGSEQDYNFYAGFDQPAIAADLNGDGRTDVAKGYYNSDAAGQAAVLNGADGTVLWSL